MVTVEIEGGEIEGFHLCDDKLGRQESWVSAGALAEAEPISFKKAFKMLDTTASRCKFSIIMYNASLR